MDSVADQQRKNLEGQMDFFSMAAGVSGGTAPVKEIPLPDIPEFTPQELMNMEKERENNDVIKREFVNEQKNANTSFSYKSDDETLANTVENTYSRMDSEYEPLKN